MPFSAPFVGHQLDAAFPERLVLGDGDVIGLERHPTLGEVPELPGDPRGDVALGLQGLDPVHVPCRLDVSPVGCEDDPVGADQTRCVRALEARQPEDVDRVRDEKALGAEAVQLRDQAVDSGPTHRGAARSSSASL